MPTALQPISTAAADAATAAPAEAADADEARLFAAAASGAMPLQALLDAANAWQAKILHTHARFYSSLTECSIRIFLI